MKPVFKRNGRVLHDSVLIGHLRKTEGAYEFTPWDARDGFIYRVEKTRAAMRERIEKDADTIDASRNSASAE